MTTDEYDIPLGYLPCRSLLHAWEIESFKPATSEDLKELHRRSRYTQTILRIAICSRCKTVRLELFGRNNPKRLELFTKFATRYSYPEGYLYHGEGAPPKRANYTTALFERFYQGRRKR